MSVHIILFLAATAGLVLLFWLIIENLSHRRRFSEMNHYLTQQDKLTIETQLTELTQQLAVSQQQNNELKKRIEILESIVTDSRYQLNKEIDQL